MREKHWRLLGGNILDKYMVKLMPKAYRDLDDIEMVYYQSIGRACNCISFSRRN